MPEVEFPILGAVFKDETPLKAEGYCVDVQGMRIKGDGWQTQGGRQKVSDSSFSGVARGATAWGDGAGTRVAAFGTQAALNALYGGVIYDITPQKAKGTLVGPFTMVDTETTVTVSSGNHGLKNDDVATFSNADASGGIIIDGGYSVTIVDINRYTIEAASPATSNEVGGGNVEFSVPLDEGLLNGLGGTGYGAGLYGAPYYGHIVVSGSVNPRVWTMAAWGQNGLFCPAGGAIYEWQPRSDYTTDFVTNGDFATDSVWTKGTGWTIGSGEATATAGVESRLEQDGTSKLSGGIVYEIEFTVTISAGSIQMVVDSHPIDASVSEYELGEAVTKSATYTRRFYAPPSPTDWGFKKDSAFAGSIDDVSIKLVSTAYRIQSAPPYAGGITVDANNVAICWNTIRQDGVYDPHTIRWTPPGDNTTWLSSSTNLAGSNSDFGAATRIVRVLPTQNFNLVFANDGVHLMQFTGDVGDAYQFASIGGGAGLIGTLAVAEHAGTVFWMGADKQFYIWRGGTAQVVDCPLRRDVADNLDDAQLEKITCHVNSEFTEVRWSYPDKRDGNEISRAVVFNFITGKWYNDTEAHSQYIGSGVFLETLGFSVGGYAYSTDAGFSDNGDVRTTSMTTADYDLGDGHNIAALGRFIPDFDDQIGNVDLIIEYGYERNGTVYSKGPFVMTPTTRKVDFRINAKWFRLKLDTANADTFFRAGSFRMDVAQTEAVR